MITSEDKFWFKHWPKAGLIAAVFVLLLLFLNSRALIGSFEWLYWLSLPLYMIHQFEEYVYPGGFKEELNKVLLNENSSSEILTDKAVLVVNIGFIWILTPVLIVLGVISIIFPIILMTLVAFNGFIHLIVSIRFKRYNPGLIASLIFNIPLGLYVLIGLAFTSMAVSIELFIGVLLGLILHMGLLVFLLIKKRKASNA
jgi:hypothetical protein